MYIICLAVSDNFFTKATCSRFPARYSTYFLQIAYFDWLLWYACSKYVHAIQGNRISIHICCSVVEEQLFLNLLPLTENTLSVYTTKQRSAAALDPSFSRIIDYAYATLAIGVFWQVLSTCKAVLIDLYRIRYCMGEEFRITFSFSLSVYAMVRAGKSGALLCSHTQMCYLLVNTS